MIRRYGSYLIALALVGLVATACVVRGRPRPTTVIYKEQPHGKHHDKHHDNGRHRGDDHDHDKHDKHD